MRRSRSLALVVVVVVIVGSGGGAWGAVTVGDSRIQVENCPKEIATGLPAGVRLELDVLRREQVRPGAPPESVTIRCDETRALIAVTMAGARREATVDLGGLAVEHRARAVALASAELVHALLDAPPAEPPAASPARPPAPTVVAAPPPPGGPSASSARAPPELLMGGLAQWLGHPAALLFGARVALRYPLGRIIVPAVSVDGALGSVAVPSAEVTARTIAAGLHVHAGGTAGPFRLEAGPGVRGGWIQLSARPAADATALEGRALGAAWAGPEVRARAAYRGRGRPAPIVAIELGAGFVLRPVRGLRDGGEPVYAVEGPWMSIGLEVGLGL